MMEDGVHALHLFAARERPLDSKRAIGERFDADDEPSVFFIGESEAQRALARLLEVVQKLGQARDLVVVEVVLFRDRILDGTKM